MNRNQLFCGPDDVGGQIRPRLSVPRNEVQAYQALSDSVVRQTLPVQPRAKGGGGLSGVYRSRTFYIVLAFVAAYAMCVWTIAVAERLAKLAS